MTAKTSDPTKDPEFQKVVQAFLHTKPKPKTAKKRKVRRRKKNASASSK